MDISNAQRARVLVHALPYIQDYSGKIVVVKYGGNAMVSEHLKDSVIRDICLLQLIGVKVVLVHGGGPEARFGGGSPRRTELHPPGPVLRYCDCCRLWLSVSRHGRAGLLYYTEPTDIFQHLWLRPLCLVSAVCGLLLCQRGSIQNLWILLVASQRSPR